jgi:hypothetical protein
MLGEALVSALELVFIDYLILSLSGKAERIALTTVMPCSDRLFCY